MIAGGLIFSGAINDWSMLTLRMLLAGEFRICIWGCSDQPLQQFEVGLLYGVMERGTAGLVAVSLGGGLALGYYDPRDSYAPGFDYVVPALVADLQAFVALGRTFGIGAYGYANLTSHTITLGGLFGLRAGRFE
jgi:hypothetical protein